MKMTIGKFLFLRMQQIGIGHIFGVPGDFNLQLLEQVKEVEGIQFVGNCNELNASYAADGYARINGLGAVLTTYGVGDLSAICGIAGSYAEHVPVVLISGVPPLYAMNNHLRMHHSMADGDFNNVSTCLKQFTCYSVCLTPENAADEIDHALIKCWREKLPVNIQVPSNISYLETEIPDDKLVLSFPKSDTERLDSVVKHITDILSRSKSPLLLADIEADRSKLSNGLLDLVKKRQMPYAVFRSGKGSMSETDPLFIGIYNGKMSSEPLKEAVQKSDCIIAIAPAFTEASTLGSPQVSTGTSIIYIRNYSVTVNNEVYEGVTALELIECLTKAVLPVDIINQGAMEYKVPVTATSGKELTHDYLWRRMEDFLSLKDIICAENGCSLFALANVLLPEDSKFVSQPIWGSIGYALPAMLGAMTADDSRRCILFIGDGSFQLTVQELSTILNRGLKPIIFLLNNRGYTIERYILGMNADYNDVADWKYTELPHVLAPDKQTFCTSVCTEDELEKALSATIGNQIASFIELKLDPFDAPESIKKLGRETCKLDYGPRGPQPEF